MSPLILDPIRQKKTIAREDDVQSRVAESVAHSTRHAELHDRRSNTSRKDGDSFQGDLLYPLDVDSCGIVFTNVDHEVSDVPHPPESTCDSALLADVPRMPKPRTTELTFVERARKLLQSIPKPV
jgi:hypothetical protein